MLRKIAKQFLPSQIVIFAILFIKYHGITLVDYINVSFLIGGIFLFFSISIFLLSSGFFDLVTQGFRRTFAINSKMISKEEVDEMRPLSELITIPYIPSMINGFLLYAIMLICLWIYYL
ncbi:DUF3899 domain-containing protein [Falsibacillus albus]|nr:DUF3899 domain-containing protein [Falsibacillus albus]